MFRVQEQTFMNRRGLTSVVCDSRRKVTARYTPSAAISNHRGPPSIIPVGHVRQGLISTCFKIECVHVNVSLDFCQLNHFEMFWNFFTENQVIKAVQNSITFNTSDKL